MQKTFCSSELTPSQTRAFLDLIKTCQSYEPVRLGFPDDAELFLFPCEQTTVISCLIVCKVQNDLWECYVFTHPNRRKKGLCRDLIGKLCELAPADTELVFLLDHQSPDALTAFSFLEMDLWRTEYQMERRISQKEALTALPFPPAADAFSLSCKKIREDGEEGWEFIVFSCADTPSAPANPVGHCRVLKHGHARFYLYHVEISPDFRRQGLGTWLMETVMQSLPENTGLYLHVSADNTPAVKLYKKTGFHITETLSYYLY